MTSLLRLIKYFGLIFILLTSTVGITYAQTFGIKENWLIGVNGGTSSFFGDLSVYDSKPVEKLSEESDLAYSIFVGKQISQVFTIKLGYLSGELKGSNEAFQLYFNNSFNELYLTGDISLSRMLFPYNDSPFDLYAIGGIGSLKSHAVKRQITDNAIVEEHEINFFDTESISNSIIAKTGLGLNYKLGDKWNATSEVVFMLTGNDMLDAQAGNTGINDYYSYISVGLSYVISSNRKYYNYSDPYKAKKHPFKQRGYTPYEACVPFR